MGGACCTYGGEERCIKGFWWGNLKQRDHLEDPGLDGRTILRWLFSKWNVGNGLDWSGSGYGQVAGTCKYSDDYSGSIKCGNFLTSCEPVSFSRRTLLRGVSKYVSKQSSRLQQVRQARFCVQLYANTKSKVDFPCSIEERAGHIQQLNEFQHVVIKTVSECCGRHATHWRHPRLLEYGGYSRNSVGVSHVVERKVLWKSVNAADHRL